MQNVCQFDVQVTDCYRSFEMFTIGIMVKNYSSKQNVTNIFSAINLNYAQEVK